MCNGIAILVWEKCAQIKGLCTGITSHDELAKMDEELKYGEIEPYRFELLYPYLLTYDRSANILNTGLFNEQPPSLIIEKAMSYVMQYGMKHTIQQLQKANLRGANLGRANLEEAYLEGANLEEANLEGANLEEGIRTKPNK